MNAIQKSVLCLIFILGCTLPALLYAQSKEVVQELSKGARKGVLVDAKWGEDNLLRLTFKMKVDKKSDEVLYEDYVFDKDLSYKGIQPSVVSKVVKPDEKQTSLVAYVGGTNSFNVLSMDVTFKRATYERNWNVEKQRYEWGKRIASEVVKASNNEKKYRGFAGYDNLDDGSVLVLASYSESKGEERQFVCLHMSLDLNLSETKLPLKGNYSLVYTARLESGNVFAVFAPNKAMPDVTNYVYVEVNKNGQVVNNREFKAPSGSTVIMDHTEVNGSIILAAVSDKANAAFNEEYTDYAPIENPGYTSSANYQMFKYESSVYKATFDKFHLLRFENGELKLASTSFIKDFDNKLVAPPSQKKSSAYSGKRIDIQEIKTLPDGGYLVAGQLMDRKITANSFDYLYGDYVCFHLDASGTLKAQYVAEKLIDGTKDQLFQCQQFFIPAPDGKGYYWEVLEVKSTSFYAGVSEAYNGVKSFEGHYMPRIIKMDLTNAKLSEVTTLGEKGKYLVYKTFPRRILPGQTPLSIFYIGHDEEYEKIWIGKYRFE